MTWVGFEGLRWSRDWDWDWRRVWEWMSIGIWMVWEIGTMAEEGVVMGFEDMCLEYVRMVGGKRVRANWEL